MLRKNVLIDLGPRVNHIGSDLIETPDAYKLLNSEGTVVDVGPQCRLISKDQIGEKCIMGLVRNLENRLPPTHAEKFGLKPHWHFMVHERHVICELRK